MDIFAHALWTNVAYIKKYKDDLKNRLWAVFFGVAPDLVSFVPATLYAFTHFSGRQHMMNLANSQLWVFVWARESYNYTHSLVSLAIIIGLILLFRKGKMYWPILGWGLHIFIDFFTHPDFYSTPILFPLTNFKNHLGISWANPYFMIVNYGTMTLVYILIFTLGKKKNDQAK